MARLVTKFGCGDRVVINHVPATPGVVTCIHVRGLGHSYEVGYTNDNGPTCCTCEETELIKDDCNA
jgi:hypothetical protein